MADDRDRIRRYYSSGSEADRLKSSDGWFEHERTLDAFKAKVPPGSSVLDIGGGTGVYAVPLAEAGYQVTLVDLSPELVAAALARVEAAGQSVPCLVGDAADLPVEGPYDAVLCAGPLYHASGEAEVARFLSEIARVLRVGGVFLGAFIPRVTGVSGLIARAGSTQDHIGEGGLTEAWETGRFVNRAGGAFTDAWFADPEDLMAQVRRAGFSNVGVQSIRGLAAPYGEALAKLRDVRPAMFAEAKALIARTAGRPDVVGMSRHALVDGVRTGGVSWQWSRWEELSRDALHDLVRLRQDVFVVEQDCVFADMDGRDPEAVHLLGYLDGALVAYLRAFEQPLVIGRVIVAESQRGTGLGRELMEEGQHRVAATWGAGPIEVGAQARLQRFYGSLGYEVCGPPYLEDGIPHLPMRRQSSAQEK